jgi:hypothetical protein
MAADVVKFDAAKTVQGQKVNIEVKDGKVRINSANVVKADIATSNGVIHVIDAVLLPPNPRAGAAELIEETLTKADAASEADDHTASLRAVAAEVLRLAPGNALVRELLASAAADSGAPQAETAAALRDALREAAKTLRFEPKVEAAAPAGFPQPTPVGEIEVKSYPDYRLARTEIPEVASDDAAFFRLFRHITSNEIAMTAPVEMTYGQQDGFRPRSMAFLYESTRVGQIGKQGEVSVADVPAMTVVSIGMRGDHSDKQLAKAQALLTAWLKDHNDHYHASGPLRVMGHNSPMVPVEKRYFEVQIPVQESTAP